jgi:hypothetical protein
MVTMLDKYTTKWQCSLVLFCEEKGLNAKDIHKEMFPVYGGKCLSHKAIYNWVEYSLKGFKSCRPHFPVEVAAEATVQGVEELI